MTAISTRIADDLFQHIMDTHPDLIMRRVEHSHYYDAEMNVPQQEGLAFPIHMHLRNRELQLVVDPFWGKWAPCTAPKKAQAFLAAVDGLLSGDYRIQVISRDGKAVKAILQAHKRGDWKTVSVSARPHLPVGQKKVGYIRNR